MSLFGPAYLGAVLNIKFTSPHLRQSCPPVEPPAIFRILWQIRLCLVGVLGGDATFVVTWPSRSSSSRFPEFQGLPISVW